MQRKQGLLGGLLASYMLTATAVQTGDVSPECSLVSMHAGQPELALSQFSGQVVYVDFWASWCPSCAKSFPFLNQLQHDFQGQGLALIGVNLDDKPEDAQQFLQSYSAHFILTADPSKQCAKAFQVAAMPSSYLIDRQGHIRYVHIGFRNEDRDSLRTQIQQLVAESTAPALQ